MESIVEQTLVLIKPDGVQRGLTGEIIKRLENRGLKLVAAKFLLVDEKLAKKHYAVHEGKPFYAGLIKYITSSPLMAMVWEGPQAVAAVRQTMGATRPTEAAPGSIRHDLALEVGRNLTHASDSVENAKIEIAIWFTPAEVTSWERATDAWIQGQN
jgi:nucleoside-diphosphate kinase